MRRSHRLSRFGILLLLALCGLTAAWGQEAIPEASSLISLNSVVIDTEGPPPAIPENLKVGFEEVRFADTFENEYLLVKFPGPVTAGQYEALEAVTDRIYTYLPHFAYLVKMPARFQTKAEMSALGASWMGPYHPAYKISGVVKSIAPTDGAHKKRSVMLHVYPDADLRKLRKRIRDLGIREIAGWKERRSFSRIRVMLTAGEIAQQRAPLAQLREVFWIELEGRRVLLNDTSIWVGQSGTGGGQATPVFDQGIYGEGQIVGVLDTGIDPDMCYFRDTTQGLPPTNECNGGTVVDLSQRKVIAVDFLWSSECSGGISSSEWDTHDHGTHVGGSVAGDDFANPLFHDAGDGMAPGAKLVMQDCGYQTDNCADCPGIGCPVVDLNPIFQQAYDQGARIHTNSWGDRENYSPQNTYSAGSQDADEVMWNNKDFLLMFAAGNSGPSSGSVGSPSTAKSVVSVGATNRGSSAESMASFSSCGPTEDGRIKPDITSPGVSIISADNDGNISSNNCGTRSMSGTSMASPTAAGLVALIRQYYADGWYPSGAASAPDAFAPSASMLKASLVNSAVDMTGVTAIPSNCQGWGRVLLDNVLYFSGDARKLFLHDEPTGFPQGSSGASQDFEISVVSSSEPFKVTLAWTDYPSTPAANPNLNNDLDLVVSGPGGTWLGNVFSGGVSTTGGSADRLNTVEQVLVPSPTTGTYTVSVRSYNIPNGPQDFALVVTGATSTCSPAPVADAGGDRTICLGDSTTLGTAAQPAHSYSWSPGGQTTAEITVSPTVTTAYTVTATTSCGSAQDAATVTVDAGGGGGLDDDLEGSTSGWTTSGLWHLTDNSGCASPGYSSATHAFYYGQDSGCNYDAGDTTGDLISPTIADINSTSTLSFDYFRQVESYSGSYDQTQVAVSVAGSGSWTTVWSRDSSDTSENAWTASGAIDLSSYAGSDIQVRFRFDSVDGSYNTFTGWFIDDVVVTAESSCGNAPDVTITAPADGSTYTEGDSVTFTGTASDVEDGDLTASLDWTSSLDGSIGSGGSFSTSTLSVGTHTITASVTDSSSLEGSDSIQVTINPANTAPTVTITAPADGSSYTEGDSVTFTGTAGDVEDGDLTASLAWTSSLDGSIGSGGSFSTSTLSVGVHTITAAVTDSGSLPGSDSIQVTINEPGNTAPTVTITAPTDGSTYTEGDSVTFTGTAGDVEDGDLTSSLAWTSSLDGSIGSGGSFSTSTLSVGVHTITAAVTDSGSLPGSDSIQVTINEPGNTAPTVTITAPTDGSTYTEGDSVTFTGTASDVEDGDLTASLAWTSSLDGSIGSGGSFSTSTLAVGIHTITAAVTDSGSLPGSDSIQVTINPVSGCAAGSIDFSSFTLTSYADQNVANGVAVEDGGDTLHLTDNTWVRSTATFAVTANTVIDFDFASSAQGEIHAIGFDADDTLNDEPAHFQFWGTQNWTGTGRIDWNPKYSGGGAYQSYSIPVGQYYTGTMYLVFTNDNDAGSGNEGLYQCVRVYETTPPDCDVEEGFEAGAGGWTNSGSSTCSTGTFVAATPTEMVNGGVTTQVGGAQAGSNAWFTATNSSAGSNDVDGGVCITESPVYNVTVASDVSVWYFHGQRDAGDDASGDYFYLEASVNGGAWTSLASYGDVTVNASWTEVTTTASAGDTVQFRVRVSDGSSTGDLVEGGVDSVSICAQ
ncbi:MAG: S8 family serine peptidase [bacterium]|nr:S8 family serine peptidase [bacterium]